jgi:hypothetical protein
LFICAHAEAKVTAARLLCGIFSAISWHPPTPALRRLPFGSRHKSQMLPQAVNVADCDARILPLVRRNAAARRSSKQARQSSI